MTTAGDETAKRPAPWKGRPRVADPRTAWVHVRCTPAEHAALTARAAQAGLATGAWLRALGLGDAGPRAARRPPVERAALAKALGLLGRTGGNLNQLAHVANATGALPTAVELAALKAEVQALREVLLHPAAPAATTGRADDDFQG